MEALRAKFPDIIFTDLVPPAEHPHYKHDAFNPSVKNLPTGHVKEQGYRAFGVDTVFEKDVGVKMRNGAVLYGDVFRPASSDGAEKVPAIIPWSPYGKSGGFFNYETLGVYRCGVPLEATSGYGKVEAPDPAEWCDRGYAMVLVNARGAGDSEGEIVFWGEQEAQDAIDTVDWASKQPWCNGSVAFAGNSWLGISQLNVAARCSHPALKAIAPWEGAIDFYEDFMVRGGIPQVEFTKMLIGGLSGKKSVENVVEMYKIRPLFDDYWASKVTPIENIDVPMYITGSYSTPLHARGSFLAFSKAKTDKKWLRVHPYFEWYDLFRPEMNDDLQRFFDRFCKNINNGWESTPRVRLSLLGYEGSPAKTVVKRPEEDFPIPRTEYRKYFLDAGSLTLSASQPTQVASTSYEGHSLNDCAEFIVHFNRYTELAGYPVVKLWMSCDEHDDMDVVVQIRKTSQEGKPLASLNYPCPVPEPEVVNTCVVKTLGPDGMLRASHRVSKVIEDGRPRYTHEKAEKITPGKIVDLEIPFWPAGMAFEAGEGLMLQIAGHQLRPVGFKQFTPFDENVGRHTIHTGGSWDSSLVIPVIN